MEKIRKSFGAIDVLQEVDFQLNEGEICALIGENGAGKSTLMNILGGVLPAQILAHGLDRNEQGQDEDHAQSDIIGLGGSGGG